MKKGVSARLTSLIIVVMLLCVFSYVSSASPPQQPPQKDEEAQGFGDVFHATGEDYWKACIREGDADCSYDGSPVVEGNDLDLTEIYSDFGLLSGDASPLQEIQKLKFTLNPNLFGVAGVGSFSAHGWEVKPDEETFLADFENDCLACTGLDDPDCQDIRWSCFELDPLKQEDCSELADVNGAFCEGVGNTGHNFDSGEPIEVAGVAGYGGCYSDERETGPGRDWFWGPDIVPYSTDVNLASIFSTPGYYAPPSGYDAIGRCCGNDPEDIGALMKGDDTDTFFMCLRNSSDDSDDFVWVPAAEANHIGDIWTNTLDFGDVSYTFDSVSNTNNWFVCNPPDSMESIYKFNQGDTNVNDQRPLLHPYQIPPPPGTSLSWGTTKGVGGEEGAGPLGTSGTGSVDHEQSRAGPIDQQEFESSIHMDSITGGSAVTECDKDGDGYDGFWTLEQLPPPFKTDPDGVCRDPVAEDCDDWPGDDTDLFDPNNPDAGSYGVPGIAAIKHPGAIDYCYYDADTRKYYDFNLDCDLGTDCVKGTNDAADAAGGELSYDQLNRVFMCHSTDDAGSFAECCSYDLGFCMNSDNAAGKTRRVGGPINTINDFSRYPGDFGENAFSMKSNMVMRYGISLTDGLNMDKILATNQDFRLGLPAIYYDEPLTNWSGYKYVEFYIWTTTNFVIDIGFGMLKTRGAEAKDIRNYVVKFRAPVIDYVVNEPGLMKWMHVKIPIKDIYGENDIDYFPVDLMLLLTDIKKLDEIEHTSVTVDWPGGAQTFSNYVGIDKFFLTPDEGDLADMDYALTYGSVPKENYYCSGTWPPVWVTDLDDNTDPYGDLPPGDKQIGKAACNDIPSYRWTGSECCGDDTGNNLAETGHPETAFKEFYKDDEAACWAGNPLMDNSRAMIIQYGMDYGFIYDDPDTRLEKDSGIHENFINRTCMKHDCVFSVPPTPELFLTNPHPELYDLYAIGRDGSTLVRGGYLPDNVISNIKFMNVPLQVQYKNKDFRTCNAAEYVLSLKADDGTTDLILDGIDDKGDPYRFGSCEAYGQYFCDHVNGTNMGWSDEAVFKYPKSTSLMLEDGTEVPWPEDLGDTVPAVNRTTTKHGYNLIRNPGFEEV